MSVWASIEAPGDFVYAGRHREIPARRREWFVPMREAFQVLWWVPAGSAPTVADAEERLAHLRRNGPTPFAFTFRSPFPAPDGPAVRAADDWICPA